MPIKQVLTESRVPVKVYTDEIEGSAPATPERRDLALRASPCRGDARCAYRDRGHGRVRDRHPPPAAVGVDIGCGMMPTRLSLTADALDEKRLRLVFNQIGRDVPVGRGQHREERAADQAARPFEAGLARILEKHPGVQKACGKSTNWALQMGTLGGLLPICYHPEPIQADPAWSRPPGSRP